MSNGITITLEAKDVFQILDALESRAEAYEKTAVWMRGEHDIKLKGESNLEQNGEDESYDFIIIEECKDASEAEEIAKHFRDIITAMEKQIPKRR